MTTDKAARPIVWLYEHNWLYELQTKIAQDNNNNNKTLKACFWKHRSKGLSEVLIWMFTIATQMYNVCEYFNGAAAGKGGLSSMKKA